MYLYSINIHNARDLMYTYASYKTMDTSTVTLVCYGTVLFGGAAATNVGSLDLKIPNTCIPGTA